MYNNTYLNQECVLYFTYLHFSKVCAGSAQLLLQNDAEVQKDSELQKWISDIFEHGFLSQAHTGEFNLKKKLIMVIYDAL